MRKLFLPILLILLTASVSLAADHPCVGSFDRTINVGHDKKDANRMPRDGEFAVRLARPLCVDENAGHKDHVVGWLPPGTDVYVRKQGDELVPVWVANCGNDINRAWGVIYYESLAEESRRDDDYYKSGSARGPRESEAAERGGRSDDRYMSREEFLLAIQAMQPKMSRWDKVWMVTDRLIAVGGLYYSYRTYRALSKPIRVQPVPCIGAGCGHPQTGNVCNYCTPGTAPRPPCYGGSCN